ncbi:MAG TPA: dihydroneopterin aldolase [Mucilaginibacter sp.]|jgi:dihydroneopterin aldolase|nr:dihydroneopterin aldolase [Mucilaginibacter sp.]
MIVALHGAEFFAWHGFYPEEQKTGNNFIVDIEVEFTPGDNIHDDELNNTVNYELLYDMICEEMKLTKKLIETVAQTIIDRVKQQYTFVDSIELTIKKLNPLVGAKTKYSSVTIKYAK